MILPGKHIKLERTLLGIGGEILKNLNHDQTVSELWFKTQNQMENNSISLTFDWFVLSLTFLYAINAIELDRGVLKKRGKR